MQVKFIQGENTQTLEKNLNDFLLTLNGNPTSIKYDLKEFIAIVEHEGAESGEICCDCKFWDDNGDNLIGLCQRCGGRKRFSDKACNKFEDVRR